MTEGSRQGDAGMELRIRTDGAEAAGSLRTALEQAGHFELSGGAEASIAVVTGDAAALAAVLSRWLPKQPPGSELTVETSTQVLTVHAGDPRAAIGLTEAVIREGRAAEEAGDEARDGREPS
jgi:hypothetical protein